MKLFALLLLLAPLVTYAQTVEQLPNGLARLNGTDAATQTAYTRLFLPAHSSTTPDLAQPTLTAECSQTSNAKPRLEIFVNFGGVTDPGYYEPWHRTMQRPTRPTVQRVQLTLSFLGYTRYKPQHAVFERTAQPTGQLRYMSPGLHSPNMADFTFYLQVLRALPTLRVTDGEHSADFLTTPLLDQLQREPLCTSFRF